MVEIVFDFVEVILEIFKILERYFFPECVIHLLLSLFKLAEFVTVIGMGWLFLLGETKTLSERFSEETRILEFLADVRINLLLDVVLLG